MYILTIYYNLTSDIITSITFQLLFLDILQS